AMAATNVIFCEQMMPPSIDKWIDHTNKRHSKVFQQLITERKMYHKSQREQHLTIRCADIDGTLR
ncbi:unnamed protein product, partial [Rotaria magnacalcarata]